MLPMHSKVDENTQQKHQQAFSVLTDCECTHRNQVTIYSHLDMQYVYLFWARSFPNCNNLATLPLLIPIGAFYTLLSDEQISKNRNQGLEWISNFWETDKLILVRMSEIIKQSLIADIWNSVEQVKQKRLHKTAKTD